MRLPITQIECVQCRLISQPIPDMREQMLQVSTIPWIFGKAMPDVIAIQIHRQIYGPSSHHSTVYVMEKADDSNLFFHC